MRRSEDYRVAVRKGWRVGRASLVLYLAADRAADRDSAGPARVGFVVSRAVGSAATRNLVKRRLREAMRARVNSLPQGSLLVVRASPAAATAAWSQLCQDLDEALARAGPGRAPWAGPRRSGSGREGEA
jgi:ribonuclease P protein component